MQLKPVLQYVTKTMLFCFVLFCFVLFCFGNRSLESITKYLLVRSFGVLVTETHQNNCKIKKL